MVFTAELAALAIPCPELIEQQEIARRVETAFAWLDLVAAERATATRLLPKLDQAILDKAFSGELVAQDKLRGGKTPAGKGRQPAALFCACSVQ